MRLLKNLTARGLTGIFYKVVGNFPKIANILGVYDKAISYDLVQGQNLLKQASLDGNLIFTAKRLICSALISQKSGLTLVKNGDSFKAVSLFNGDVHRNWISVSIKKNFVNIKGTVINLIGVHKGVNHYFHFYFDYIFPLLFFLKSNAYKNEKISILVRSDYKAFQKEIYDVIETNFPNIKFIYVEKNSFIHTKDLIYFQHIHNYFYNHKQNTKIAKTINLLRDMLLKKYKIKNLPYNKKKIVYISRNTRLRKIINNNQFINYLQSKEIDIKFLEKASLKEQVDLFFNAKLIIAVHGASLTNLIFASKDTTLIEIFPKKYGSADFQRISNILNIERHTYRANNEFIWQSFWLNLKDIKSMLESEIKNKFGKYIINSLTTPKGIRK